jgi:hypothetical protein
VKAGVRGERRREGAPRKLALGGLSVLVAVSTACSSAGLKQAPESADASDCPTGPVDYCDAMAPPSCFAGGDSGVPGDAGYPSGCTVFLPDPVRNADGVCARSTACVCADYADDAGVHGEWTCRQ